MSRHGLQKSALIVATLTLIAVSVSVGYQLANHAKQNSAIAVTNSKEVRDNRKVLYWYDPMMPDQHFDKPGKSPFMDMALQPKYADENTGEGVGIRIDSTTQQNLGIRLAPVERHVLNNTIDAVSTVGFNERELTIIQARTNGFVTRVYARAPGDVIARNTPIVEVLVPEWAGAQQEFLALRNSADVSLVDAARERLKLLGMPADLIQRIETSGAPQTTITITAPNAGVIQTLNARAGMTLSIGATLAEINGLETVWLNAAVPETLGQHVAVGDTLSARFPAFMGEVIQGHVIAVLPQTDSTSRTLTVRAELQNRDGRLRPGQYAEITLRKTGNANALTVPSEAVIRSGTRTVVIVAAHDHFQPAEIEIGREDRGRTEILKGLNEGEQVVTSGQFLIDSEANLTGVLSRMNEAGAKP